MNRLARLARLPSIFLICLCLTCGIAEHQLHLTIKLHRGDSIVEHRYESDRIDWILPRKRLDDFRRAGVIVTEQRNITSAARANVVANVNDTALLKGIATVSSSDVPRHQVTRRAVPLSIIITARNELSPDSELGVEDAAMRKLPSGPVRLGDRWQTRMPVATTLGSGYVIFEHVVDSLDDGLVRVAVRGRGKITGAEYRLPKLLPGSISMQGAAWYDVAFGMVTQESYSIHDVLVKPAKREAIGFDERRTVDISTRRI